jgi:hypothetical protein
VSGATLRAALAAAALFFSAPAFAGRPLVVDDAPAVDAGILELELGVVNGVPEKGGREHSLPNIALTYGIYPRLEAAIAIQRLHSDLKGAPPVDGFADLHLNAKYNFLTVARYDFSFAFDLKVPTAKKRLSTGRVDENFLLIATRHFDAIGVDFNFGYTVVDAPARAELKNRFFGGGALRYAVSPAWTLVGEVYGFSRAASGAKNEANFQLGVRYKPELPVIFDAALGRSLLSTGTVVQGTIGLTWDWPVVKF